MDLSRTRIGTSEESYAAELSRYVDQHRHGRYPRTILVALGGSGAKSLLELRRLVMERYGSVDALPAVAYLSIDTDTASDRPPPDAGGADPFEEELRFRENERVNLKETLSTYISPQGLLRNPHIREWWDPSVDVNDNFPIEKGAGQKRPLGRLMVYANRDQIASRLIEAYGRVTSADLRSTRVDMEQGVRVIVVAGLGGGTGSGTVLDMAALIRDVLPNAGAPLQVQGIFTLPGVVRKVEKAYQKVAANGAAALREMNHYRTAPFKVQWGSTEEVREFKGLFERYTLYAGTNYDGQTLADPADAYRAIGEMLFLDFWGGEIAAYVQGIRVNRAQYLEGYTRHSYRAYGASGTDEEVSSERFYTFFSSFGIAKLVFPSWRLLNYARFDLAAQMVARLDPGRDDGAAVIGNLLVRQFMHDLGILQGRYQRDAQDTADPGEHWQVRDRLLRLAGQDGTVTDVYKDIERRADDLLNLAESMFTEKTTSDDCEKAWKDAERQIGDINAPGQEGMWIRELRRNRAQYPLEVEENLPRVIQSYWKRDTSARLGPSGIVALLNEVRAVLGRNADQEKYKQWFQARKPTEVADAARYKAEFEKAKQHAVQAGTGFLARPGNHEAAMVRVRDAFRQHFQCRIRAVLCDEAVRVLEEIDVRLQKRLTEVERISRSLLALRANLEGYRDFYRTPRSSSLFTEIQIHQQYEDLLADYVGKGPARDRAVDRMLDRCERRLGIDSLENLASRLNEAGGALRRALATEAFQALKGEGEPAQTMAFSGEGEGPKPGFIRQYSALAMLERASGTEESRRRLFEDLYKRGLPWMSLQREGATRELRPKADAFLFVHAEGGSRAAEQLQKVLAEVRKDDFAVRQVQSSDPSEITLYTELNAFPAFMIGELHGADGMRTAYEQLLSSTQRVEPLHIHQDYHEFPELVPLADDQMNLLRSSWKLFFQAIVLGQAKSVRLRDWDPVRVAWQYRVQDDFRTSWQDLGPENAVVRRLRLNLQRLRETMQQDVEAARRRWEARGVTVGHLAVLADYYQYFVFPVIKTQETDSRGVFSTGVGSVCNQAVAELAAEWREEARRRGATPADLERLASSFERWVEPVARTLGTERTLIPATADVPGDHRLGEWAFGPAVRASVRRMREEGRLPDYRNVLGRQEDRFPRVCIAADGFGANAEAGARAGVGGAASTAGATSPGAQPDRAGDAPVWHHAGPSGTEGPLPAARLAELLRTPGAHHVWKEGMAAWADPRTVPELAALLAPPAPPTPPAKPTPPAAPPRAAAPPPDLPGDPGEAAFYYQVDGVAQGGNQEVPASAIARSVQAQPGRRHRVYYQGRWCNADEVPEVVGRMGPFGGGPPPDLG